jgi:RNA polymerase sigma factor (sigma-70 family)
VESNEDAVRLSRIKTRWSMLFQAHQGQGSAAQQARCVLLLRYYGAVYRYLLGVLRDPAAAEERTQDFAVRFLAGAFSGADPERGRFRDYLKTALRNLAHKHWEAQKREKDQGPQPLAEEAEMAAPASDPAEEDRAFVLAWREELLARTWKALRRVQEETGTPCHTVLHLRTEQPHLHSAQLAEQLAPHLGKVLSEGAVHQAVKRARDRFADLLLDEVSHSLGAPLLAELEQELIELGLLEYCKSALRRRARAS